MKVPPVCPRCGNWIPNNHEPGAYPGAISRVDNKTEICSGCGVDEALEQFSTGAPAPMSEWEYLP
jgi:ribosomal protein S27AE